VLSGNATNTNFIVFGELALNNNHLLTYSLILFTDSDYPFDNSSDKEYSRNTQCPTKFDINVSSSQKVTQIVFYLFEDKLIFNEMMMRSALY
jgi:hypothetical protein